MKMTRVVVAFLAIAAIAAALVPAPAALAQGAEGPAECRGGKAAGHPCKNIDLLSHVAVGAVADVWGWVDPETKKEYAVLGTTRGAQFLDVSDPENPVHLGTLLGKPETALIWVEIEILNNHMYMVCDLSPCNLQIFDLTRLSGVESAVPVWRPDVVYPFGTFHSIGSNPDTDHIFLNGIGAVVGSPAG
ncbi:MAG TPA: choice-of-anchor B family protein, partial [Actinomycetota bacterium]|nr:choice-of-anchor B family protein [Actinomycetota bacterium]